MSLLLLFKGGLEAGEPYASYWGHNEDGVGHFPEGDSISYWDAHFPEPDDDLLPGTEPGGAGAFVLRLERGAKMTLTWETAIHKSEDGSERRRSNEEDPAIRIEGDALLLGSDPRAARARIAQYASLGTPFMVGLPWEELSARADSDGTTYFVHSTTNVDWMAKGARAVIAHPTEGGVEVVIQSFTSTTIELDVDPGAAGGRAGSIMPALPMLLDPQQGFARYSSEEGDDGTERWLLKATAAIAGISGGSTFASLSLAAPVTNGGELELLTIEARTAGIAGNAITIEITDDALTDGGEIEEDPDAGTVHLKYAGEATTVQQFVDLFAASSLVRIVGTYTAIATLASGDDEVSVTTLSGGTDQGLLEIGQGATVDTFRDRYLWDRPLMNPNTVGDSVQTLAKINDFGALPFAIGRGTIPDWGRQIFYTEELASEFQWIKKFLWTIRGAWKSFWCTSMRADLVFDDVGVGTIDVLAGENAGNLFVWWPLHRNCLEILQDDGSEDGLITRVRIVDATDNGDDTITVEIVDENEDPVSLSADPVLRISWLDICRLDKDVVTIEFKGATFSVNLSARVVQQ